MKQNHDHLFENRKYGRWSILIRRGLPWEEAIKILSPEGNISPDENIFTRVRSSGNAEVFLAPCICSGLQVQVYFKHYLFRDKRFDFLKHLFRAGRGKRALQATLMLLEHGFKAPEPLALLQKMHGPFATENILLTRGVDNSVPLGARLKELSAPQDPAALREKRRLIYEFGSTIGRMHDQSIIHGDLRLNNVLVQHTGKSPSFFFIDNESTRKYTITSSKLVKKNLVQINMQRDGVSNTDRIRFMRAYNKERNLSFEQIRVLSRLVVERTDQRLEKKLWKQKKDKLQSP